MGEKKWYLEYSVKQRCYHIDTMESIILNIVVGIKRGLNPDYAIIAGPLTMEDVSAAKLEIFGPIGKPYKPKKCDI